MLGVTNTGLLVKATVLDPLSSVRADARLALEGVAKKVATPVPRPLTPELIGNPVAFVKVPDCGVPSIGVTRVGLVAKTKEPEPVSSEITAANSAEVPEVNKLTLPRFASSNPPEVAPS